MIGWLLPGALSGLVLALGPLLIHLLRRRRARRMIVPTVRFVPTNSQSSVRAGTPDDLLLLLLRTAAIAAAVVALAGPIVLTEARIGAWNARVVRAVVVDASPSAAGARSEEVVTAELQGAHATKRIESASIGDGLRRAAAWISTAPPGRREVVVVSDFQHGSVIDADIEALPAAVGVRFVRTTRAVVSNRFDAGHELFDGRPAGRTVALDGWKTRVQLSADPDASLQLQIEGTSPEEAARLTRILRTGGVAWPRSAGMTIVRFGAADHAPVAVKPVGLSSLPAVRLLADPAVQDVPFTVSADGDTLVVSTSAAPSSLDAAVLVHAAVSSWRDPTVQTEAEVQAVPPARLQAWTRPPGPVDASSWRQAERSDARWFWLASLMSLAAEWWLRRRPVGTEAHHARAA